MAKRDIESATALMGGVIVVVFVLWLADVWPFSDDESSLTSSESAQADPSKTSHSPESVARAAEIQRMKPFEDLRVIDGYTYRAEAYEAVVGRLAKHSCTEQHSKIADMAVFTKNRLRGFSAYKILMDLEKELREFSKSSCADKFAAYILLNGGS